MLAPARKLSFAGLARVCPLAASTQVIILYILTRSYRVIRFLYRSDMKIMSLSLTLFFIDNS